MEQSLDRRREEITRCVAEKDVEVADWYQDAASADLKTRSAPASSGWGRRNATENTFVRLSSIPGRC
jgi:hypothetical protein